MHDERFWEVVEYAEDLKMDMPNYFIEWTPLFDEMSPNAGPWEYKDPKKTEFLANHNCEMQQTVPKPGKRSYRNVSYNYYRGDNDHFVNPTNSNDIIVNRQNFFEGWECNVGDCIFINPVGEISLASCGQGGVVGHILEDVSNVGPKTIICGKHHCHCGTDIIIPKVKKALTL